MSQTRQTEDPATGTALSSPPPGCRGEEVSSHLDTNRGKQKPSHPLGPALPAWQQPMPAAYSWRLVLEPRTQASLLSGTTDPSRGRWRRGAKAPLQCLPPRTGPAYPPSPGASAVPATRAPLHSQEHGSGWSRGRCPSLTWPEPHPRPMESRRKNQREGPRQLETPGAARCHGEDQPPRLLNFPVHLPRGSPAGDRAQPSSVLQRPHLRASVFSVRQLLPRAGTAIGTGTEAADLS